MQFAMSTTRAEVLRALRQWGAPVAPPTLAHWMNRSPMRVADCLSALYARNLVNRERQCVRDRGQPGPLGHLYTAKGLQS